MTQATLSTPTSSRLNWLTVERLAYGLLFVVPTVIRLIDLGGRTLAPAEVATALRAWQQAQGMHPALDAGQPLLFTLQSLTFFVAGATDAAARFWPVWAVGLLPLAFYFARTWLGRWPALIAATLITLSPTVNAMARRGDGAAFALLAAAAALAGLALLVEGKGWGWKVMAVSAAVLLLSGPAGYAALLPLVILVASTLRKTDSHPTPTASDWVTFGSTLILGGTLFLVRFDALGLAAINLTDWMQQFGLGGIHLVGGVLRLALDEPLLSLFGLMGVVWGMRTGGFGRTLALAALVAGLLALFQGPDATASRAVAALFLALPVAAYLVHLAGRGDLQFHSLEQILFVVVLVLLAFLSVYALVAFANTGKFNRLIIFGVSLLLALGMTMVFLFFIGWQEVRGGLVITAFTLTLLFGLSSLWSLGFNHTLPTLARAYTTEALPDVKDLVRTYGDLSQQQRGDRWAVAVALVPGSRSDELILWYFRRAEDFRVVEGIAADAAPPVIIAPAERDPALEGYAGQRFEMLTDWDFHRTETTNQLVYWLLFRRAPFPPPSVDAVNLWVSLDLLSLQQDSGM
ncbi:MAG TPA: hypothetical protein ENK60_07845 [Anaerolineae bacterium]|nr:hypothetical protein [Anaerolineae bacterium]